MRILQATNLTTGTLAQRHPAAGRDDMRGWGF